MRHIDKTIEIIELLHKEGVIEKYALGGAVGAMAYLEPFNTKDVDVFVHVPQYNSNILNPFQGITEALAAKGFTEWDKEGIVVHGWPVQFLPATKPLEAEALDNAITQPIGSTQIKIVSPEYLMAICIDTGRGKDRERIGKFLATPKSFDPVKLDELLAKHDLAQKFSLWKKEITDRPVLD